MKDKILIHVQNVKTALLSDALHVGKKLVCRLFLYISSHFALFYFLFINFFFFKFYTSWLKFCVEISILFYVILQVQLLKIEEKSGII